MAVLKLESYGLTFFKILITDSPARWVDLQSKKPELVDRLESWNNLYNEELEYFNTINGGKENND